MVKCYDKAKMGVCALSVWEIFSWGLTYFDLGPEFQCLLKVKEELNSVLIFQNAKNNVSNWLKIKIVSFFSVDHNHFLTTNTASIQAI